MALSALVFSQDERVVRILKAMLADFAIQMEHTSEIETAQQCLRQQKYDGVFAECETEDGARLLCSVRRSKHNTRSVVFALSESTIKMRFAFELGAHFVIHKPLIIEKVKRTLKAAHGLMMREQRSHFRHPTATQVTVKVGENAGFNASLRDLSQSGALLECGNVLRKGQRVNLRFLLPETCVVVEAVGTVTWSDPTGRAGVKFESLSEVSQRELLQWVIERSTVAEQPKAEKPPVIDAPVEIETRAEVPFDLEVVVVEPEPEPDPRLRTTLVAHHESPIKVLAFSDGRPIISQGVCKNVSELGLSAELDDELAIGDSVLTQITFPDVSRPMILHAMVQHREGTHHGFQFVALPDSASAMLRLSLAELPVD